MSDAGNPNDPNAAWGTPPADQPGYGAPQGGYGAPQGGGYGAPPGGTPGYGQQPYGGQQQWGAPPGYAYNTAPTTEGKAIGALICAIASFVICPFVPAVVAVFLAGGAKRSIEQSGGRVGGEGLVTAARIIAWVNIALSVIGFVLIVIAVAVGGTAANDLGNDYQGLARLVLG